MRAVATVPASSANLGPGFDCLALALGLYNTLELEETASGLDVHVEGEGAGTLPRDERHLSLRAAQRLFEAVGHAPRGLRLRAANGIPPASGLGSSSAAIVAGLLAADALSTAGLSRAELLHLAYELEGHADNAAACLYGGLNVVAVGPDEIVSRRIDVPDMQVAVALPALSLSTQEMRGLLPSTVTLADAVHNLARVLLTVEALRGGDLEALGAAAADRLHEQYRTPRIPGYEAAAWAAREAGAAAVVLSGAGPGVIAFAASGHEAVSLAMVAAFKEEGIPARAFVLPVDAGGGVVRLEGET